MTHTLQTSRLTAPILVLGLLFGGQTEAGQTLKKPLTPKGSNIIEMNGLTTNRLPVKNGSAHKRRPTLVQPSAKQTQNRGVSTSPRPTLRNGIPKGPAGSGAHVNPIHSLSLTPQAYGLQAVKTSYLGRGQVAVRLRYKKETRNTTVRILASVASPHNGKATPVIVSAMRHPKHISGQTDVKIKVECATALQDISGNININYELQPIAVAMPGRSPTWWPAKANAAQSLPFTSVCSVRSKSGWVTSK